MSRIVLKERKFNPTNNDLGVFSSVDLETVEMRYKESDVVNDSEGNDGNKSKNHVPKPKDEDSIKPSFDNFKPPDSSGGSSGGSGNKKKDEDKGKEKVDLENIQEPDIESEDFSNNQDNQGNGESGTGSSSEEGGDSENQSSGGSSGEQMNGGNSSPINNNKSKESEGEDDSGQGQNGSNQNNQNGNSNGNDEDGEDTEDGYGGDEDFEDDYEGGEDSEDGSSQGTNGNSQKSENEDNGSDLEGQGGDSGEQASQNSSDDSKQDGGSGNSQNGEDGNNPQKGNDGSQNNKPQNSKQEGESSNNSNSQNGQGGQSKDSPDGDSGNVQQGEDGNEEGSDRLEGWDDEEDDYGEDSESELEKALKKAENSLSDLEKKEREKIEKEDKTNDSKPQPKQLSDVEKKAAKDLIEDAIRSAKDKGDDENVEEMNDLLSKLDAHTLTSMVNVRGKGDWKHQLDKIFDQATGAEISINPNLVNKRIEDAPPGREDDTNQITHIAVLMDQSGSMGSHKFKTAISHVDTMLSVRKLGNVNFHIVGFAAKSLKETAATYKKTKGRMLKKILLSEYANSGGGTHLTEAFQVLATKVRKVDAIMIFTDAEVYDGKTFNDNQMVMSYVKRNKRKIIWVLTHDESEARQKSKIMEFTPYSAKNKLYVRFKKSSS